MRSSTLSMPVRWDSLIGGLCLNHRVIITTLVSELKRMRASARPVRPTRPKHAAYSSNGSTAEGQLVQG